jgi:Tol biopolymer transport system component
MGLYFADLKDGKWVVTGTFVHNRPEYSVTDPSIDEKGTVMYFSSDKSGGFGGRDIYRSERINDAWTKPEKLGEAVNTNMDEVSPYVNDGMLYFSSNGHPGMGGLDIYKIEVAGILTDEPSNLGYPINSSYDDFAITFTDQSDTHGLLSSNRKRGALDDDLYEFDIDMQTYPFVISGIIKQMDHAWSDSSTVKALRNARILLVDNIRNVTVLETKSDDEGRLSLAIPYFSKYSIHVFDDDGVENMAVFDLPRQRKASTIHEIVVIKDIFQTVNK